MAPVEQLHHRGPHAEPGACRVGLAENGQDRLRDFPEFGGKPLEYDLGLRAGFHLKHLFIVLQPFIGFDRLRLEGLRYPPDPL